MRTTCVNSLAVRCPHVSPPSLLQHQWSEKEREGDDERPYVEAGALPLSSRATVGQIRCSHADMPK